jgi:hypothetical protein
MDNDVIRYLISFWYFGTSYIYTRRMGAKFRERVFFTVIFANRCVM